MVMFHSSVSLPEGSHGNNSNTYVVILIPKQNAMTLQYIILQ